MVEADRNSELSPPQRSVDGLKDRRLTFNRVHNVGHEESQFNLTYY